MPLIVVLGHDSCGAVKATISALDDGAVPGGYVRDVVERVTSSILLGRRDGLTRVDEFEARHVIETGAQLMARSTAIAERVNAGTLAIAGVTTWPTGRPLCGRTWATSARPTDRYCGTTMPWL